eukprot:CAMPEP_0196584566 /NCGR_PEP_ID=MMETSP1081-20130531/47586_1 /TAXON_ID=36882 /ORGANISM="Pyramimonas amylifera, Strain CCMP720" /LENGTH=107 /DNA_ID=CAMNT_0041905813 /DNA_START=392 /DNA_END=715 /DNA_ORIENTATION=+
MEEGRHWEGIDMKTSEERANWRRMLKNEESEPLSSTWEARPPWYLNNDGVRIPAFRIDENGKKFATDRDGNDFLDANGNPEEYRGAAGNMPKQAGFDYEYDDYYYDS